MNVRSRAALACATALLVAACGSMPGLSLPNLRADSAIVPGKTTQKDLETARGKPAEILDNSRGEKIWYYNYAPYGGKTDAVTFGPDGVVRSVEQRLTRENVRRVECGRSTARAVRALLGPPLDAIKTRAGLDEWRYRLVGVTSEPVLLHLGFSGDGVVREIFAQLDPAANSSSGNLDLLEPGMPPCRGAS
jgi:hypothetical protein